MKTLQEIRQMALDIEDLCMAFRELDGSNIPQAQGRIAVFDTINEKACLLARALDERLADAEKDVA